MKELTIRQETPADYAAVEALTREAFWNVYAPGCSEHYLLHRLRGSKGYLPELHLLALEGGEILGSIVFSRAQVHAADGSSAPVLCFGPLSVLPACQRQGIGSMLVKEGIRRAQQMGERAVIIYGNPAYYQRFGFRPASDFGISTAEGENFSAFMALPLYEGALEGIRGRFQEDAAFSNIADADVEAYDQRFPMKHKQKLPGQLRQLNQQEEDDMHLQENLKKYAALLLQVGLNVQPGDNILLRLDEHSLPLAREIARQAYQLGAHYVHPVFSDDELTLARFFHAPDAAMDEYPGALTDFSIAAYQQNFHILSLHAPNPELLKDVPPSRISRWQKASATANQPAMKYTMENRVKWVVAALPSPAWAGTVFPELPTDEAIRALWQKIFEATRVTEADPIAAWAKHEADLVRHETFLNEQRFEKLIYQGPGTNLTVHLPKGHIWVGGSAQIPRGDRFMANIPTEEVFSMPHAYKVDGSLAVTKPLSTRGRIIDGMRFTFKDGEVVDFDATVGKEILSDLLDTDPGARRLGEVALVGDDSPISNTGLLFKNTLFDENASCHFALGNAYGENLERGSELTDEEKRQVGMNQSITHVDFMVGGPALHVTGVRKDGTSVPILVKGNWVV